MFLTSRKNPYRDLINDQVTSGKESTFGESFSAGYASSAYLTSYRADAAVYADLYKKNSDLVKEVSGEDFNSYDWALPHMQNVIKGIDGVEHDGQDNPVYQSIVEQNKRLEDLNQKFPQIRTAKELRDDAKIIARQMEMDIGQVSQRSGVVGMVGEFAGGLLGSFTTADPVNISTFFMGGAGKTVLAKMASEAALNSGVEVINQFTGVPSARKRLGLEELSTADKLKQVAFAAGGAAIFRGGLEVAPKGYSAIEAKLFPEMSQNKKITELIHSDLSSPDTAMRISDYINNNAQMSEVNKNIARQALDSELILIRNNPYDKSGDGLNRFVSDVNNYVSLVETGKSVDDLMGGASLRSLEPELHPISNEAAIDLDTNIWEPEARANSPEVFKLLDEQKKDVESLLIRISEAESVMRRRGVEDSISLTDPILGDRVKAINSELDANPTAKRRKALEKERDIITESIDIKGIKQAESDYLIGASREIRALKKSLSTAKRKLKDSTRLAHKSIDDVIKVNKLLNKGATPIPKVTPVTEAIEDIDAVGKAMVSVARKSIVSDIENGKVEIGGRVIDLDTDIPIESISNDGVVIVKTAKVKDILKEIEDDEKLVKAMETCLL